MPKDWEKNLQSSTVLNGMVGTFDPDSSRRWSIQQDITPYLEQAKRDREMQDRFGKHKTFRKLATIPDIVAIDILTNHGIDVHHEDFGKNPAEMKKFRYILQTEFPELLINT